MRESNNRRRGGLTLLELVVVLVILVALGLIVVPMVDHLGQDSQHLATRESMADLQELIVNRYVRDLGDTSLGVRLLLPRQELVDSGARAQSPHLCYLFVNPSYHEDGIDGNDHDQGDGYGDNFLDGCCWRGPYLLHRGAEYQLDADHGFTEDYGQTGDPTVFDAWGHPLVLQWPTEARAGLGEQGDILRDQRRHVRLVSAGRDGVLDTPRDALMPNLQQRNDDIVMFLFRNDEYGDGFLEMGDR